MLAARSSTPRSHAQTLSHTLSLLHTPPTPHLHHLQLPATAPRHRHLLHSSGPPLYRQPQQGKPSRTSRSRDPTRDHNGKSSPHPLDREHRERSRQHRITDKLLNAAKLGIPPARPQTGSDPYAGWKPTPGQSSRRNLGRPALDDPPLSHRFRADKTEDVHALLGPYTAKRLCQPLEMRAHARLQQHDHDPHALFLDDFLYPSRKLPVGTFVELRKAGIIDFGIVLPPPDDEREPPPSRSRHSSPRSTLRDANQKQASIPGDLFVLVSSGIILLYRDTDVMIQVPHVVEPSLAHRAAARTRDHVVTPSGVGADTPAKPYSAPDPRQADTSQVDPQDGLSSLEQPVDEARFEARAAICNKMRILERQKEKEMQRLLPAFRSLFLAPSVIQGGQKASKRVDLATGTITTYEATRIMNDHLSPPLANEDPAPLTVSTILAGHTLLMNTPSHFLADTLSHRTSQLYTCRSAEERETFRLLTKWIQSPPGSKGQRYIDDFCRKARTARAWSEARPYQPEGPPQAIEAAGIDVNWSKEDRTILSFLEASLASRREIQGNTHGSIAMEIVSRAGAHIRAKPHPWGKHELELDEAAATLLFPVAEAEAGSTNEPTVDSHALEVLKDLGGEISATSDLQHALVMRFLKSIGFLAPWHNPLRLDATFRALVAGSGNGQPELDHGSEKIPAPSSSSSSYPSSTPAPAKYDHGYDDAIEKSRYDFGQALPVYVIDDAGAFELDDGVSIEPVQGSEDQFWVHVHVADPTASMRPGDALGLRARRRFSTLYFPEARWSLLPDDFVNSGLGIRAPIAEGAGPTGQGQRVFTLSAKVDARNGQVDDYKVRPAWVHNVQVMSYDRVNEMLRSQATNDSSSSSSLDLSRLLRVAKALSASRVRGTAFNAWRRNASISLSPLPLPDTLSLAHETRPQFYTGSPTVHLSVSSAQEDTTLHASQFLVSELMLLAGRVSGSFGEERDIPLPYRLQPRPEKARDVERILAMRDANGAIKFEEMLAQDLTLSAGMYSDRSGEHFGLGICTAERSDERDVLSRGGYIRATSPLRRYPDMVAHWQMKSSLVGRPLVFDRTTLVHQLGQFERSEILSKQLHRAATRAWLLKAADDALRRSREGRATQEDEKVLGPHEAIALLTDTRVSPMTLTARLRVQVEGLGTPADLIWDPKAAPPEKGTKLKVRVVATVQAGLRGSLVVQEM